MTAVFFFIAAIGALAGAFAVVTQRNAFYAVLGLVFHLLSLSVLFLTLRAQFVAAAQVIVYAGAVMVLYVFVVAYVGGIQQAPALRPPVSRGQRRLALLFAAALFAELTIAVVGSALAGLTTDGARVGLGFGNPGQIGELLLTKFLLPFEAASFLLLIAAVGAVALARRRAGLEADIDEARRLSIADLVRSPRAVGTGTMAESVRGLPAEPGAAPAATDGALPSGAGATAGEGTSEKTGGGW
jgi:NADH:ubiquinone oxidoreductase subunit 6 (subunit J)